ncbi:GerMN domain-containing protein [Fundicoccus culcitae]|uniref:GerMN domain-containing protein n=1 Tax=Fundicoccus culcitae TaxID=2969821 RepID=A0ABY5P348_9LACT|nr:GerMN domain-containing protein [Fundicoccus culcitae]UUX33079.1 GerMN domain-containing protein [Fundicoccus culcitae]
MNKYYFIYLIIFSIFLVGCSSEPMIRISDENQAIMESKRQASIEEQQRADELAALEDQASVEESASQTPADSQDQVSIEEEAVDVTILDPTQWSTAAEGTIWELNAFIPYQVNQIRQFAPNPSITYVDFTNDTQTAWQVREFGGNQQAIHLIELQTEQITQVTLTQSTRPFVNYLSTLANQTENSQILLQAPVTVGTTWTNTDGSSGTITALYDAIDLNGQTYPHVVEVTTSTSAGDERRYYGADQGLLLVLSDTDSMVVDSITDNVQIVVSYPIWTPNEAQNQTALLVPATANFNWQTNSSAASIFTQLFRNQNWIDDTVSINSIQLMEDAVTIDFTPGVVAAMNRHPATEQGVIPAIVTTMSDLFNVTNVILTVNGNGLLPDTLPYPTAGSWQVNPAWLSETTP